jgi:hypothetical protein
MGWLKPKTISRYCPFKESKNRFQGFNFANYSLTGRYDNPLPTQFLAPIDRLKIPAQLTKTYRRLTKQLTDKRKDKWRKDRKLTNKQQTIAGYNLFA